MSISYLEVMNGPDAGTEYRLMGQKAVIGRSEQCEIRLPSVRGVSRQHAQLTSDGQRWFIRDLKSQNGTIIDGERVEEAELIPGAVLKIGPISLVLKEMQVPQPSAKEAPPAAQEVPSAMPDGYQPPYANLDPMEQASPDESVPAGGGGSLWMLILVILVGCGLYLVSALSQISRRPYKPFVVLQMREERVLNLKSAAQEPDIVGESDEGTPVITLRPFEGLLKDVIVKMNARNKKVGAVQRHFVVIFGQSLGEASIVPKGAGSPSNSLIRVYVRGHAPYAFPEDMSPRQALDLADQYAREAVILREDRQLYAAWQSLELAFDLEKQYGAYRRSDEDVGMGNQIRFEITQVKSDLRKQLGNLFEKAMHAAFPDKSGLQKRNYRRAYAYLQEAKRLVPDEKSQDWQVLSYWEVELKKRIRKRRP